MKRKQSNPRMPAEKGSKTGASGLPNLDDFETEATATRQTETSVRGPISVRMRRIRPTLTVLTGLDAGRVIALEGSETIVGRATDCQLLLSDPGVSRYHARIIVRDDTFVVTDLDSKNGTFIGLRRVAGSEAVNPSDVLQLGPNVTVRLALMSDAEEKLARELYDSSMRDALTSAFNRRYFMNRLKAEVAFAARHKTVLSLVLLDIDHFKKLNDARGHAAGDAVLRSLVSVAGSTLRAEDVLARIGGEEFAILLRGIGRENAVACAERVRVAVASTPTMHGGEEIIATVSAGAAASDEATTSKPTKLVELADKRLYKAKSGGRNRVCGS